MRKVVRDFFALEVNDKIIFFLLMTTIGNIITVLFKFILGLYLSSIWFLINAMFYLIGTLARYRSIKAYQRVKKSENESDKRLIGYKNYFQNGMMLVFLGVSYLAISYYMFLRPAEHSVQGVFVYLVALQAFWSLGVSIYGMIKYKRNHNPIIAAVKITNFCNSLTSIVLTQVVLMDSFSDVVNFQYNGLTGMIMSGIIILTGIYMMIVVSSRKVGVLND